MGRPGVLATMPRATERRMPGSATRQHAGQFLGSSALTFAFVNGSGLECHESCGHESGDTLFDCQKVIGVADPA